MRPMELAPAGFGTSRPFVNQDHADFARTSSNGGIYARRLGEGGGEGTVAYFVFDIGFFKDTRRHPSVAF